MVKKKAKKPTKAKTTKTSRAKRKVTTRKRRSGNPFEIDNVPNLI